MVQKNTSKAAGENIESGGFFIKSLWIITFIALALRLISSWEMATAADGVNNVLAPLSTSDLATYMELGRQCARGNFPETFYYQPYYYAVFLVLCNWIGGGVPVVWIIIQALLSSVTVLLTGWCGKKIFSERAGLIAAGLTAVSSSLILYVPFCQNETLQTFHLILLFSVTLWTVEKRTWYSWVIVGSIAGISILTRGNVWLVIPVITAVMIVVYRKELLNWKITVFHLLLF